jgi:hypothetical protein
MQTLENTLRKSHDWAVDRMDTLQQQDNYDDAGAIMAEFSEWLNCEPEEDVDIFSLEYIGD